MSLRPLPLAILSLALAGSAMLRGRIDRAASAEGEQEAAVYVRSGETLRRFSLGYEGLLADFYWTRAVQYFGREKLAGDSRFEKLDSLLATAVNLDPQLLIAYRFGAI